MILNADKNFNSPDEDELTPDAQSLIMEATILENLSSDELIELLEDSNEVSGLIRAGIVTEKTIVRLDRRARLSRAQMVAVYTLARKRKDPIFRKLLTLWRIERAIDARLIKKYGSAAMRIAKKSMSSATAHPSPGPGMKKVINRVAMKQKRQLNALKDVKARQMSSRIPNL